MAKGTAISLPHGSTVEAVVDSVRTKYADKRKTASGWHGVAVVNIAANNDGKGEATYLVKGTKSGFEVFGHIGSVEDVQRVTKGKFKPAS